MDDDLNTPQALAALFTLAAEINRIADAVLKGAAPSTAVTAGLREARDVLQELLAVLGLVIVPHAGGQVTGESPIATGGFATSATTTLVPGVFRVKLTSGMQELAADLRRRDAHLFAGEPPQELEDLVVFILRGREQARKMKDFKTADAIRSRLAEAGILVEDLPTGPRWRIATPDERTPA